MMNHTNLDELHLVCFVPCQLLHVLKHPWETVAEIVNQNYTVAMLQQHEDGVTGCSKTDNIMHCFNYRLSIKS